jgi:hypothetical protein
MEETMEAKPKETMEDKPEANLSTTYGAKKEAI